MTIFKYINKKDNSLIGYHLSTFCQVGLKKEEAKIYSCDTEDRIKKQLETIRKNFNYMLSENPSNIIIDLTSIKDSFFKGLTVEDVEIKWESVPKIN